VETGAVENGSWGRKKLGQGAGNSQGKMTKVQEQAKAAKNLHSLYDELFSRTIQKQKNKKDLIVNANTKGD